MGKKCIPGMFCIENMTLALILFILLLMVYLFYRINDLGNKVKGEKQENNSFNIQFPTMNPVPTRGNGSDIFNDPYIPPLRTPDGFVFIPETPSMSIPNPKVYGNIPVTVSVATQPFDPQYRQMGILTRNQTVGNTEILPLMGRRNVSSRDKWQYYTVTGGGNGNMQTKLPVSVNGKSCTGEYGCDQIYNNDTVYVEGYKDIFTATVYESSGFSYIP
jgi:hypothetical protein